ncbi:MAG: TasA family protein, partial [Actinomycetota bacterium]
MSRRRRLYAVLLTGGLLSAAPWAATQALFADTQAVDANAFTTGTVDISTNPTTALITFSAMAPGDMVTNPIVVSNAGTLALRYSVSSTATNTDSKGLKDELDMTIKTVDLDGGCDDFDGTSLYTGDLDSSAGKILGDVAQGAQTGDRTLAAAANETLCFRAELPTATGNGFQGATTTATFTFDAEQTANN